ncbi:MAG: hypothetical protein HY814_04740 [Candidatus Riflebacteria bacterium]|nr:hypothetical protein [Candidatus Riflebacteria bacterium]
MNRSLLCSCLLLCLAAPCLQAASDGVTYDGLTTLTRPDGSTPAGSERVVVRSDGRYYAYDGTELFAEISRNVYGDPSLWYLIYRQNQDRLEPGSTAGLENGKLLLRLPEPPEKRVVATGTRKQVRVMPGDTFMTLSQRLYGTPKYWRGLYLANRDRLPDSTSPFRLFGPGETGTKLFDLPEEAQVKALTESFDYEFGRPSTTSVDSGPRAPESTPDLTAVSTTGPAGPTSTLTPGRGKGNLTVRTGDLSVVRTSGSDDSAAVDPLAYRKTPNAIASLDIQSASQIGEREAKLILEGTGLMKPGESVSAGLKKMYRGYTYRRGGGALDNAAKQRLFREYTLLKTALNRWGKYPTISAKATPQLFETWLRDACLQRRNASAGLELPVRRGDPAARGLHVTLE